VIRATDVVQHTFWKFMDPLDPSQRGKEEASYTELLRECYRTVDWVIGNRLGMMDEDSLLFVVSDHGFTAWRKIFYPNYLLRELGLLVLIQPTGVRAKAVAWLRETILETARTVWRKSLLAGVASRFIPLPEMAGLRDLADFSQAPIDWRRSVAYCPTAVAEAIRICPAEGSCQPYEDTREAIISRLKAVRDPDTGQHIVKDVLRRECVYKGDYVQVLPDIVLDMGNNPYLVSDRVAGTSLVEHLPTHAGGGKHSPDGIFVAFGSAMERGKDVGTVSICDVAPTVLYAMDLPVGDDMDGRVLSEAFVPAYAAARPVRYQAGGPIGITEPQHTYTAEEQEDVEHRLRSLGYLE
jgi:predicted AlkP superfamily phosphohydrolase/phosphomutase